MPYLMSCALAALAQAAQTAAPADPIGTRLVEGAAVLILSLQAWVVRKVSALSDDVATVRQALFGVNNDNGINSKVEDHETRIAECEAYITRTVPERLKLWESFKESVERRFGEVRDSIHKARDSAQETTLTHGQRLDSLEYDRRGSPRRVEVRRTEDREP